MRNIHLLLKSLYPYVTGTWPGFKSIFCAAAAVGELFKVEFPAILQCFLSMSEIRLAAIPLCSGQIRKVFRQQSAAGYIAQNNGQITTVMWSSDTVYSVLCGAAEANKGKYCMYFFFLRILSSKLKFSFYQVCAHVTTTGPEKQDGIVHILESCLIKTEILSNEQIELHKKIAVIWICLIRFFQTESIYFINHGVKQNKFLLSVCDYQVWALFYL